MTESGKQMSIPMESSPAPPAPAPAPPPPPLPDYQTESPLSPLSNQEKNGNQYDYRFQRTDQWMPVYSWLESLNTDEIVQSKDILDWLTANPDIRDQLSSRHSKYHLMHYIKKCHMKIMKRKGKDKGVFGRVDYENVDYNMETRGPLSVQSTGNALGSPPEDNEIYKAKHKEALEKYEILVEMEKQLLALFPSRS